MINKLPFPTARLNDGQTRTILFDAFKCIGCRQCVDGCKDWNNLPRGNSFAFSPSTWITIEPPISDYVSEYWGRNSCRHCDYPMCATVCPVEAITKYDEGPVVINHEVCIRCQYCTYACPWGVVSLHDTNGKAVKCTMCVDRLSDNLEPFCVHMCPVGALEFGPRTEMEAKVEARAMETKGHIHGKQEAGGTQVLYLLSDGLESHGLRQVGREKYPVAPIPLGLKLKGPFTLSAGFIGKLRAIKSALLHPGRLKYRYWPWRRPEV
jgi:Fe-S-cluster-containing dehydrogenase component